MFPETPKAGDEVYVPFGGDFPFLLRGLEEKGHFQLVDQCYTHGIMEGQLDWRYYPAEAVCLAGPYEHEPPAAVTTTGEAATTTREAVTTTTEAITATTKAIITTTKAITTTTKAITTTTKAITSTTEAPDFFLYLPPQPVRSRFVLLDETTNTFHTVDITTPDLGSTPQWKSPRAKLAIVFQVTPADDGRKAGLPVREESDPEVRVGNLVSIDQRDGKTVNGKIVARVNVRPLAAHQMSWEGLSKKKEEGGYAAGGDAERAMWAAFGEG